MSKKEKRPKVNSLLTGNSAIQNVREIMRKISKGLLEFDSNGATFHIEECQRELLAFNQYLSLILLHHPAMQVRYTVHFMLNDAMMLAARKTRVAADEITREKGVDYFKEYCNVLAGNIADSLSVGGFQLVHSLPFAIQGYNDIFFPLNEEDTFCDAFYLSSDFCKIGVSVDIAVIDIDGLEPIKGLDVEAIVSKPFGGDFQFL